MEDASPTHLPCPAFSFSVPREGKAFGVITAASPVPGTVPGPECELHKYLPSEWMDGKTDHDKDGKTGGSQWQFSELMMSLVQLLNSSLARYQASYLQSCAVTSIQKQSRKMG